MVFVKVSLMWVLRNKKKVINERKRHKNTYKAENWHKVAKKDKKIIRTKSKKLLLTLLKKRSYSLRLQLSLLPNSI